MTPQVIGKSIAAEGAALFRITNMASRLVILNGGFHI
jgi:hypothetical protein